MPIQGDIQIGMVEKKGALEVEVIRARGLVGKPGSKALPGEVDSSSSPGIASRRPTSNIFPASPSAPYVKVYLLENGACIAKKKTKVARKTLDPLYQQQLPFEENPAGKVLQVRLRLLRPVRPEASCCLTGPLLAPPPCRSSFGATTDAWTTNPSWGQFRYC